MNKLKSYSVWSIVFVGFLMLALSYAARTSLSLAMPIWRQTFGWSTADISANASIAMIVMAVMAPLAGHVVDRHGSRRLLTAGLACLCAGMFFIASIAHSNQQWMLWIGFSALAGIGFGSIAQHVIATAIAQRLTINNGLATGIALSGSSAGQLLFLPLISIYMTSEEWQIGFWILGFSALILLPVSWYLINASSDTSPRTGQSSSIEIDRSFSAVPKLFKNFTFHLLFWSYLICGFTTSGVIETHFLPFAAYCGFPPFLSSTAFGILSGMNLLGMILAGWLADRTHRPTLLFTIYALRALTFLFGLTVDDSYISLLVFSVIFGLFDYSTVPVTVAILAKTSGKYTIGIALGLLSAGHAIGGATGAYIGGWIVDQTGNYTLLWILSSGLAIIAALLVLLIKDSRILSGSVSSFQLSRE